MVKTSLVIQKGLDFESYLLLKKFVSSRERMKKLKENWKDTLIPTSGRGMLRTTKNMKTSPRPSSALVMITHTLQVESQFHTLANTSTQMWPSITYDNIEI